MSPQVGEWVKGIADARGDANYEIVDIADYKLPLLGESDDYAPAQAWAAKFHTPNVNAMLDQVLAWSGALKSLRS